MWRLHVIPDLLLAVLGLIALGRLDRVLWVSGWLASKTRWTIIATANCIVAAVMISAYVLGYGGIRTIIGQPWGSWLNAAGTVVAVGLTAICLATEIWRAAAQFEPNRRAFLRTSATFLGVAPFVATSAGIICRNQFQVNEVEVSIPGLHKDLHGLRLVQISDIHLSPFLSERDFARAVDMANGTRAHIALVTGDLISRTGDPLDACLRQLARVRAEAGVFGCLGNHEVYTETEDYVTEQGARRGITFLRGQARSLRFGQGSLNIAGVDYQKFHQPYLSGAKELIAPGQTNILLSHNPDVFPVAAKQGYALTIAGHTHGGQVNFEILKRNLNIALTYTPFVRGLYRQGDAAIYVCSGLGTIGVPVRLGAPPEVSVIRLCAT